LGLWEEQLDELFVGEGDERGFDLITTSHPGETLDELTQFAELFQIEAIENEKLNVIRV
jgi:hypothetical protein